MTARGQGGSVHLLGDKVQVGLAPVDGTGQSGRRVARDLEHGSHRVHAGQRRHAVTQLDGRDPCGTRQSTLVSVSHCQSL